VLFDFDAVDLADEDLWLTGFIPDAVYVDMLGDDFLDPVGPSQFVEKLRRAGYPKLRDVPLALKREVAGPAARRLDLPRARSAGPARTTPPP